MTRFASTENTARDLDIMRAALGDERLYYLGFSYGTYLGAIYADLFPPAWDAWCWTGCSIHP